MHFAKNIGNAQNFGTRPKMLKSVKNLVLSLNFCKYLILF
jgi:hypothetical protein